MGATDLSRPDFQLGPGCLVDQLVGQYMAHICGLGYLLVQDLIRQARRMDIQRITVNTQSDNSALRQRLRALFCMRPVQRIRKDLAG